MTIVEVIDEVISIIDVCIHNVVDGALIVDYMPEHLPR